MHSRSLPALRPTEGHYRLAAASTLPSSHYTADYTYTPQLKAYTAINKHWPTSSIKSLTCAEDDMAAQVNDRSLSSSAPRFEHITADTPHRTATLFQAKLQRALWLDQRTTCVHEESSARAGLRCGEAEAREALWWSYQHKKAALSIREDYATRAVALMENQAALQQQRLHACCALLVKQEEPEARRAIEEEASSAFQLLCVTASTRALQLSAQRLEEERERAKNVEATAQDVRALELNLATRSYYAIPAFNPFMGDLPLIAEGVDARPTRDETPLEAWRRRYPGDSGASSRAAGPNSQPPAQSCPVADQCTVKGMELYARRFLHDEEEKERLLLDMWKVAGDLWYVQEAQERDQLWRLYRFVASPSRMQAVVVLQRWWRMQRLAPWSQHRRKGLARALSQMPQWHSTERYRRRLRALETPTAEPKAGNWDDDSATHAEDRLHALVAAATHPRRYAMQLSLYIHSLTHKARAFGVGAGLETPRFVDDDTTALYKWRQTRWLPYSTLSLSAPKNGVEIEQRPTQSWVDDEPRLCALLGSFASDARGGVVALRASDAARLALTEEARKARLRICQQEEYERRVWASSCGISNPRHHQRHAQDVMHVASPHSESAERLETSGGRAIGKHGGTCRPALTTDTQGGLARAQHCVQQACCLIDALNTNFGDVTDALVASSAPTHDEAVEHYRGAFDWAAELVYTEQYATVMQRYAARNANLLSAIQCFVESFLVHKSAVAAEESEERQALALGHPSGRLIAQGQLMRAEEAERLQHATAQARQSDIMYDSIEDQLKLLQLAQS